MRKKDGWGALYVLGLVELFVEVKGKERMFCYLCEMRAVANDSFYIEVSKTE